MPRYDLDFEEFLGRFFPPSEPIPDVLATRKPADITLDDLKRTYERLRDERQRENEKAFAEAVHSMSMEEYAKIREKLLDAATGIVRVTPAGRSTPIKSFEDAVGGLTDQEREDMVVYEELIEEIKAQQRAEGLLVSRREPPHD